MTTKMRRKIAAALKAKIALETLHAKIGQLTIGNDFFATRFGK